MLDKLVECPNYSDRLKIVTARLGFDPIEQRDNEDIINSNKVSSALTVLASSISLDLLREEGVEPAWAAGYSVGQWTALYAAGCIEFAELIDVIVSRAEFMDQCSGGKSVGMVAVIGLPLQTVQEVCSQISEDGAFLSISNYNCTGQYSIAGESAALTKAIEQFEKLPIKKVQRLPVAGAWHCELLAEAREKFSSYLQNVSLSSPLIPVLDNVSGDVLPSPERELKLALANQISAPVQWEKCVQSICRLGCTELVEVGFGNVLTKFGFFINRKVAHRSFYCREEVAPCAG